MPALQAYLGPTYWPGGSFRPYGPLLRFHFNPNPRRVSTVTWAARLFVGFNVGSRPKYTMDDLVNLMTRRRAASPDASFVAQRGIYTSHITGQVVQEEGAQVIIILGAGANRGAVAAFEEEMATLAEAICHDMEQEAVIVEIQRNGVVKKTIWVTP